MIFAEKDQGKSCSLSKRRKTQNTNILGHFNDDDQNVSPQEQHRTNTNDTIWCRSQRLQSQIRTNGQSTNKYFVAINMTGPITIIINFRSPGNAL